MGIFLATQIDPGSVAHNKKVLFWQLFWGCRSLYMRILLKKIEFFSVKSPETNQKRGRADWKPISSKNLVNFQQKSCFGQGRPPQFSSLNRHFKKSVFPSYCTLYSIYAVYTVALRWLSYKKCWQHQYSAIVWMHWIALSNIIHYYCLSLSSGLQ